MIINILYMVKDGMKSVVYRSAGELYELQY